jgi:hypothetical protein
VIITDLCAAEYGKTNGLLPGMHLTAKQIVQATPTVRRALQSRPVKDNVSAFLQIRERPRPDATGCLDALTAALLAHSYRQVPEANDIGFRIAGISTLTRPGVAEYPNLASCCRELAGLKLLKPSGVGYQIYWKWCSNAAANTLPRSRKGHLPRKRIIVTGEEQ